jgi:hypothetical protein
MQFKVFEPEIEVSGESLGAIVDGFRKFPAVAQKYLSQYGFLKPGQSINELDRTAWYPQEKWLAAFEALTNEVGVNSLYSVGRGIPENAIFPPHLTDVYSALASLDIAYHLNHRKSGKVMFNPETGAMLEGIGHMIATPVPGESRVVVVSDDPYPCDFERGVIGALAKRFEPGSRTTHDADAPCRKKDAESCTYVVWW